MKPGVKGLPALLGTGTSPLGPSPAAAPAASEAPCLARTSRRGVEERTPAPGGVGRVEASRRGTASGDREPRRFSARPRLAGGSMANLEEEKKVA